MKIYQYSIFFWKIYIVTNTYHISNLCLKRFLPFPLINIKLLPAWLLFSVFMEHVSWLMMYLGAMYLGEETSSETQLTSRTGGSMGQMPRDWCKIKDYEKSEMEEKNSGCLYVGQLHRGDRIGAGPWSPAEILTGKRERDMTIHTGKVQEISKLMVSSVVLTELLPPPKGHFGDLLTVTYFPPINKDPWAHGNYPK